MNKKLPGIYRGKVKKNKNQKQSVFSINNEPDIILEDENNVEKRSINRQIKDIFSSPSFVYKADVLITMVDGENMKKTIIGRTNNSLITIDDELIDVSKISKIDFFN